MKKISKEKQSWFEIITNIIIWSLGILLIYWLVLKLTNHSPTFDQIIGGALGILGTVLAKHHHTIGELKEFKENTKRELDYIRNKVDKIEFNTSNMQSEISFIKTEISFIKSRS
ncbi:hypothetical protein HYV79_01095 [Candidatus Woesearchaeota archaeon]|nr:hypothetical protein [Candidatus Woesearchaeota archaeon]